MAGVSGSNLELLCGEINIFHYLTWTEKVLYHSHTNYFMLVTAHHIAQSTIPRVLLLAHCIHTKQTKLEHRRKDLK
jgi:hypothetical protein